MPDLIGGNLYVRSARTDSVLTRALLEVAADIVLAQQRKDGDTRRHLEIEELAPKRSRWSRLRGRLSLRDPRVVELRI